MTAEASPSAGALRMRRQRARRLRDVRIVSVECTDEAFDALVPRLAERNVCLIF